LERNKGGRDVWIEASYIPVLDSAGKPVKVIEFNLDGTIVNANQNFLNAVGYPLAEITGKHHGMFAEHRSSCDRIGHRLAIRAKAG
jgi:methyl-accepting chemotaxis protein